MSQAIDLAALSRFAARVLNARPELAAELAAPQPVTRAEMSVALAGAAGEAEGAFRRRLRRLRTRVFLRVMARDLVAQAPLEEVCGTMSDLAEVAIASALEHANARLRTAHGTPRSAHGEPQQLIVVAMGKLGGRELNVSSDIDLVFLYPEEGETDGKRQLSNHEYFERLGR